MRLDESLSTFDSQVVPSDQASRTTTSSAHTRTSVVVIANTVDAVLRRFPCFPLSSFVVTVGRRLSESDNVTGDRRVSVTGNGWLGRSPLAGITSDLALRWQSRMLTSSNSTLFQSLRNIG